MEDTLKTGTTTLGLVYRDGVILAADKRATAGYLIANKHIEKVLPIHERMVVTTAGSVSDLQLLVRYIKSELNLREQKLKRVITPREAAHLLSAAVYSNVRRLSPITGVTHFLLGGFIDKPQLFEIFPDGSISEVKDFVASGSGTDFVYGVLEAEYKKDLSMEEAKELAKKAINASLKRDIGSGGGIDIVAITKDGIKYLEKKEIEPKL